MSYVAKQCVLMPWFVRELAHWHKGMALTHKLGELRHRQRGFSGFLLNTISACGTNCQLSIVNCRSIGSAGHKKISFLCEQLVKTRQRPTKMSYLCITNQEQEVPEPSAVSSRTYAPKFTNLQSSIFNVPLGIP